MHTKGTSSYPTQAATAAEPEAETVPADAGAAPASASAQAAQDQPESEPPTTEVHIEVNVFANVTQTFVEGSHNTYTFIDGVDLSDSSTADHSCAAAEIPENPDKQSRASRKSVGHVSDQTAQYSLLSIRQ